MFKRYSSVMLPTLLLLLFSISANAQIDSIIEGWVRDESNQAVYNAYVELYNSNGTMVDRQRTSSMGRFTFRGMPEGRYRIEIKPFGTKLLGESRDVELIRLFNRTTPVNENFTLKVDKRFVPKRPTITGTVFAQEIPEAAKKLYDSAMDALDAEKNEKAVAELEKAIEIFPTYFDALGVLGKKFILEEKPEQGYPFLLRAVEVNKKCPDCYYTLAIGFSKMKQFPAALQAAEFAAVLQPGTPEYQLLFGMLLRNSGDLVRAEKALLSAKSSFKQPHPEVFWELSLIYNKTNRNAEAADALEAYLKAKPDIENSEKQKVKDLIAKMRKSK